MTTLPREIINRIMLFHSQPTTGMIRPFSIQTALAMYMHQNQHVCWLISNESANMNSNAYEMYVLSKCIRHKDQVKYISEAKTFDKLFNHSNTKI